MVLRECYARKRQPNACQVRPVDEPDETVDLWHILPESTCRKVFEHLEANLKNLGTGETTMQLEIPARCTHCGSYETMKSGKVTQTGKKVQRHQCKKCGKTFLDKEDFVLL